jgi:hypothetical protein
MSEASYQAQLQANGCGMPLPEFQRLLVDLLFHLFTTWSVDDLLVHPDHAKLFCDSVRWHIGCPCLPDDLILRCLRLAPPAGNGAL